MPEEAQSITCLDVSTFATVREQVILVDVAGTPDKSRFLVNNRHGLVRIFGVPHHCEKPWKWLTAKYIVNGKA